MSFTDRLVLWLHLGFAIFTIGPLALAISSVPRYIRRRDVAILRYLSRITVIFTVGSLLVLVFGIVLGQQDHDFSHPWLTASLTLFLVAIVLLVLIIRDERGAIKALAPEGIVLAAAGPDSTAGHEGTIPAGSPAAAAGEQAAAEQAAAGQATAGQAAADPNQPQPAAGGATLAAHVASVERGRIAAMGGVVNLIWLVILALMVWRP
jgi:hypothetical protein